MENNRCAGIYLIRNLLDGKVYVGSACNIPRRWRYHLKYLQQNRHQSLLQNAWNKYGPEAFAFEILEEVEDRTQLVKREQMYIWLYDSANRARGYNLAPTAGSSLGRKASQQTKLKLSAMRMGNQWRKGTHQSLKTRAKISAALKGRKGGRGPLGCKRSPETRAKMSAAQMGNKKNQGHILSNETRKKISIALRGNQHFKGHVQTPEAKAKVSAARKAYWARKKREATCPPI